MLPDHFIFTQQNLQNYVDCNRRFYLHEILRLEWPAIESEPVREQEELILLGTKFHLLCQQYFSGIPAEVLLKQITSAELEVWWLNFLKLDFNLLTGSLAPEKMILIPFGGFRLAAKFDLLIKKPDGKTFIYDWKTSKHLPKRKYILDRMQSKVYPLVISKYAGATKTNPDAVEMVFWYPAFPETPITHVYSNAQLIADQTKIELLISEITQKNELDFKMTDKEKTCAYCRYRSLCNRGVSAGVIDPLESGQNDLDAFDFDFESI